MNKIKAICILIIMLLVSGCGDIKSKTIKQVNTYDVAKTPNGYKDFCKRTMKITNVDTYKTKNQLNKIYFPLHDNFNYVSDIEKWGVAEYWTIMPYNDLNGDCEDFVLTLEKRLLDSGFRQSDLRFATCLVDGEDHAVLLISLSKGEVYVADYGSIQKYSECDYEFEIVLDQTKQFWLSLK